MDFFPHSGLKYSGKFGVWGVIKSVPKHIGYKTCKYVFKSMISDKEKKKLTKLTEVLPTRKILGQLPKLQKQQP